jgi:uncharacterized protein YggE
MAEPTIIRVEQWGSVELVATGARLSVRVSGTGGWSTSAATARSAEVRALVAALVKAGLPEEAVALRGVQMKEEGGVFGRSTQATYSLLIRVDALDHFGDVLTAISEQKNTALDRTSWRFDEEAGRRELVASVIRAARARADVMAAALGTRVTRVRSVMDRVDASTARVSYEGDDLDLHEPGIRRRSADPGLTTIGTRTLVQFVTLEAEAVPIAGE